MKRILTALALLCALGAGSVYAAEAVDQRAEFRRIIEAQTDLPAEQVDQIVEMAMNIDNNVYGFAIKKLRNAIEDAADTGSTRVIAAMTEDLQLLEKAATDADFRADFSEGTLSTEQAKGAYKAAMDQATGGMFTSTVGAGLALGAGAGLGAMAGRMWDAHREGKDLKDVGRAAMKPGKRRALFGRSIPGTEYSEQIGTGLATAGAVGLPMLARSEMAQRAMRRMGRWGRMGYERFRRGLGWVGAQARRMGNYFLANPAQAAIMATALATAMGLGISQRERGKRWYNERSAHSGLKSILKDLKKLYGTDDGSLVKLNEAVLYSKIGEDLNKAILKELSDDEKELILEDPAKAVEVGEDGRVVFLWSVMGPLQEGFAEKDLAKYSEAAAKIAKHRADYEKKVLEADEAAEKAVRHLASVINAIEDYATKIASKYDKNTGARNADAGEFDEAGKKAIDGTIKEILALKDQSGVSVKDKLVQVKTADEKLRDARQIYRKARIEARAAGVAAGA